MKPLPNSKTTKIILILLLVVTIIVYIVLFSLLIRDSEIANDAARQGLKIVHF